MPTPNVKEFESRVCHWMGEIQGYANPQEDVIAKIGELNFRFTGRHNGALWLETGKIKLETAAKLVASIDTQSYEGNRVRCYLRSDLEQGANM